MELPSGLKVPRKTGVNIWRIATSGSWKRNEIWADIHQTHGLTLPEHFDAMHANRDVGKNTWPSRPTLTFSLKEFMIKCRTEAHRHGREGNGRVKIPTGDGRKNMALDGNWRRRDGIHSPIARNRTHTTEYDSKHHVVHETSAADQNTGPKTLIRFSNCQNGSESGLQSLSLGNPTQTRAIPSSHPVPFGTVSFRRDL
jgi:hypothetical protein